MWIDKHHPRQIDDVLTDHGLLPHVLPLTLYLWTQELDGEFGLKFKYQPERDQNQLS